MTDKMNGKIWKLMHLCEEIDDELYIADDTDGMREYIFTLERALRLARHSIELM